MRPVRCGFATGGIGIVCFGMLGHDGAEDEDDGGGVVGGGLVG